MVIAYGISNNRHREPVGSTGVDASMWWSSWAGPMLGCVAAGGMVGLGVLAATRVPDISGVWTMTTRQQSSLASETPGMDVTYLVMLSQRRGRVEGIAERVRDVHADGSVRNYTGSHRQRAEISGGLLGGVFERHQFQLLFREHGAHRSHATTHRLERRVGRGEWRGQFCSSAASVAGQARWSRGLGSFSFRR